MLCKHWHRSRIAIDANRTRARFMYARAAHKRHAMSLTSIKRNLCRKNFIVVQHHPRAIRWRAAKPRNRAIEICVLAKIKCASQPTQINHHFRRSPGGGYYIKHLVCARGPRKYIYIYNVKLFDLLLPYLPNQLCDVDIYSLWRERMMELCIPKGARKHTQNTTHDRRAARPLASDSRICIYFVLVFEASNQLTKVRTKNHQLETLFAWFMCAWQSEKVSRAGR